MSFRINGKYPEFTALLGLAVTEANTYQHISMNTARAKEAFIDCIDIIPESIVSEIHDGHISTVLLKNGSLIIFRGFDTLDLGKTITGIAYVTADMV